MKKHLSCFVLLLTALSSSLGAQDPFTYKTEENILYRTGDVLTPYMKERCVLDIYYPASKKNFATIVWFHGGGITSGNKHIPDHWKQQGIAVVAVNYRLHPKVSNPAYIEDAAAAVAWVFKNIGKYGGATNKIIVSGHSAGGYLASMIGLDKSYLATHGINADSIAALIPFSGHTITHMTVRKEMGYENTRPVVDRFAPLFHVRRDAPPLYLISGDRELEMLGRYEETAYMFRMMKVAGHTKTFLYEMDGFDHGGMAGPGYLLTLKILKALKLI